MPSSAPGRRYLAMLVVLALIWGSSFMFIKIAVRQLDPATLILGRLGLAALTLAVVVAISSGVRGLVTDLRAYAAPLVLVGLVTTAAPFWLLSWGETRIDSGLASIIQASVPIFNALLAFAFFHEQRVAGAQLLGVAVGFLGVASLVGAQPGGKLLGALAVVGMAACYALGGLLTRRLLTGVKPETIALGTSLTAALAVSPVGIARAPSHAPSAGVVASIVVLGVLGTAFAYLLFFSIISGAGAAYASLVTYLVPPVALAYGAIFLGESVGIAAVGGLVLILAGVALGTRGLPGLRRERAAAPSLESS
jgi:drug/metabolite transporter (DMT)-like permease